MPRSPFRWPRPIDESKSDGGLFYGSVSPSEQVEQSSETEADKMPGRQRAIATVRDWLGEDASSTRKVPCLFGVYGIGKSSVFIHVLNQKDYSTDKLIDVGSHDDPFSLDTLGKFIADFARATLQERFKNLAPERINILEKRYLDSTSPDDWRLARSQFEEDLTLVGLQGQDLYYLVESYRIQDWSGRLSSFQKWVRTQESPIILIIHSTQSASDIAKTLYPALRQGGIKFLVERRTETPQEMPSDRDGLDHKREYSNYMRLVEEEPIEIHAFRTEEAMNCVCGVRAKVLGGEARAPNFCPGRRKGLDNNSMLCPRPSGYCSEAKQLIKQAGTHPFFLQMLCYHWDKTRGLDDTTRFDDWLEMHKKDSNWPWREHLEKWWGSLPAAVKNDKKVASWLSGKGKLSPKQYLYLSNYGVVFRNGRKWAIPNLVKEWWTQRGSMNYITYLDQPANNERQYVMSPTKELLPQDIDRLVNVLANQSAIYPVSPQAFFKDLVRRANLPAKWGQQLMGVWTGVPDYDARDLVTWAIGKGGNPKDPRYTTLGSLTAVLLPELGVEDSRQMAAIVIAYSLYRDNALLQDLTARYHIPYLAPVPTAAITAPAIPVDIGPDFEWRGTTDRLELQSFWQPEPEFQDVGSLVRAVERASSVCLIEVPKIKRQGTGFLIGEALVLTNYHVLYTAEEDLEANARETVFNFGKISTAPGQPPAGQSFRAASGQSIVRSSTVDQLDYVLLRVDDSIRGAKEIKPAPFTTQMPYKRMGLNILQHPEGETMKLALSSNGVVEVFPERGLVQYTTRAEGGSSGAPCFTNDWQVIALHHAERSKAFGVVREGIIFEAIHKEIAAFL